VDRVLANEQRGQTKAILECRASNGIATQDAFVRFAAEPSPLALYDSMLLNARGNQMIASLFKATLSSQAAVRHPKN